jgi:hypothetical protein
VSDPRDIRAHCGTAPTTSDLDSSAIPEYDVWRDENGFHARRQRVLSDEALRAGCRQLLHAPTFDRLERMAAVERIKASWLTYPGWQADATDRPAGDGVTRPWRASCLVPAQRRAS